MKHGSLFSGIGGFDLASEMMGWENVFHCEYNDFSQKVLKYYWPKAISYGDIKQTNFTIHRGEIDILTGGFPCQPYSLAGKRKGKEDERHLWPEMLRAVREIQPTWVVGENVFGLINWNGGLVFDEVQTDLEAEGYEVWAYVLPACAVNAPHRRDRVWFVAYSASNGHDAKSKEGHNTIRQNNKQSRTQWECAIEGFSNEWNVANTDIKRYTSPTANTEIKRNGCGNNGKQKERCEQAERVNRLDGLERNATNTNGRRQSSEEHRKEESGRIAKESVSGNWENFPTQSPIRWGDDGLSTELAGITFPKWRNESIKAFGNAIVPQVIFQIFKSIEQFNQKK